MIINEAVTCQKAIPIKWGLTKAKTGKDGFWMQFKFVELSGDGGEELTVQKNWWLGEDNLKGIEFFLKDMDTLGWHGSDLKELETFDFRGPGVLVSVEMHEYEGKMYARATWINPLDYAGANKPMEAVEVKTASAKYKAKFAAYRAKHPVHPATNGATKKPMFSAPDPDLGY